ncbi:UDP-2,3-diacylglucosamine diphosphatase, partial [Neisseria gonorrhoeae]
MRPSYFISDLHLSEKHPELTELLLRFLRSAA